MLTAPTASNEPLVLWDTLHHSTTPPEKVRERLISTYFPIDKWGFSLIDRSSPKGILPVGKLCLPAADYVSSDLAQWRIL